MNSLPICFGRWITQSANKCEQCSIQLECYSKMRENEKKQEKLEALKELPWYRRNNNGDDKPTYGVCEKCG